MESTVDALIGKVIFNRYRVESKIGEGGRGQVYQAFDLQLQAKVAVKRLFGDIAKDPQVMRRFAKEPRVTHLLKGPYVVFVYAFDKDPILDEYFSVMEYVPDGTLSKLLDNTEQMPIPEALRLAIEICEALEWIHEQNVVHRDLKPANILLTKKQRDKFPIKLADFGIAYQCDQVEEWAVEGTPWYASPEQLNFDETSDPLDGRSDLYSLGIILYEMLTGDPPFQGNTLDVIKSQCEDLPTPPRNFRPDLLPSLNAFILKALAKNPIDRFQSAREMNDALKVILAEEQQRVKQLNELYSQAMEAFVQQDWEVTFERFAEIVKMNPLYRDAPEKLQVAQKEVQLTTLYREATELIKQQRWEDAKMILTEIQGINPHYQDIIQKFEIVEQQIILTKQYLKGTDFQSTGNWGAAQKIYVQILTTDASYEDVAARLVETQRQQKLANLYNEALQFIKQEHWNQAVRNLEQVVAEVPNYDGAADKLKYAQEQAILDKFFSQGISYEQSQDWGYALDSYKQVVRRDPDYKNAAIRLVKVQNRLDIRTNYEKGENALTAENWVEAIQRFEAVLDLDPTYKDTTVKLEKARQEFNLATRYNEGLRYFTQGQLKLSLDHLVQVVEQEKDYKDADGLIKQIYERIQLEILASQAQEFYEARQWSDAIEMWDRVLENDPNYPDAVRLQVDAKFAQAKALCGAKQWYQCIKLMDEILETKPDYQDALQFKLDTLFKQAVADYTQEQWQEAINVLDQLLKIDSNYPKASELRYSACVNHVWDKVSRNTRRHLVKSPFLVRGILVGSIIIVVLTLSSTYLYKNIFSELQRIEIWVDELKVDSKQPQDIVGKSRVKIEIKGFDLFGSQIDQNMLLCHWTFLPPISEDQHNPENECTFSYQAPSNPNLHEQSILIDVIKTASPERNKLSTSATLILQHD